VADGLPGFVYEGAPHRLVFGPGVTRQLDEELRALGVSRPLLVSTRGQAERAAIRLAGIGFAGRFPEAAMHTPVDVTRRGLDRLRQVEADGIVSFGGGSATGLGKALAIRTDLPLVAIGTTYGGSEMTALIGETENGVKSTRRDRRALPRVTIYDVELTLSLPPNVSAASGLNAMAHAVEAIYAPDANPIVTAIALDAIRALTRALPGVVADPGGLPQRSLALRGACEAGLALNAVQMGLHHKLCHVLGGLFNLPHAETHAVVLPYAMAYNSPAVTSEFELIASAMGATDAVASVHRLARAILPVRSLRELGMPEEGVDRAAGMILANPYRNPQPLEPDAVKALLRSAWAGAWPAQPATGAEPRAG
jgi:maleylacetate reductase